MPNGRLRRAFARLFGRSFEAAAGGRRWDGAAPGGPLNAAIAAGGRVLALRAAHQARNNAWAAAGVRALVANVVGGGIMPQSEHRDPAVREALHALWNRWACCADPAGRMDVYGLQSLVARSMIEAGEAFVRFRVAPDMTVPLQLQILDPDQVDRGLHRDLDGGGRIRAGVEFDGAGRRVAYHVFPDPPGDMLARALAPVRVPATELLHIFEPLAAGQVRGVSWFAPTLLRLREIDEVMDATLLGQKIRAMLAGFVIDANGEAGGFAGTATAGAPSDVLEHGLEPGTLRILPPGTDIRFSDPAKGGSDYHHFLQAELRAVAAGLGVTYEQLTGDMTGVNFSSARVALIEFRRRVSAIQHQVLVQQFIRPVWQRFVRLAVLAGAVDAPGFAFDPEPWLAARFMPPAWDYVNPFQDVQADAAALEAGLKSRSEIIAARGRDPERVDAEIAADMARAARLGLSVARPRSPASFEKEPEDA